MWQAWLVSSFNFLLNVPLKRRRRGETYADGGRGLDQHASSDGGHSGGDRARETLGSHQGAQILVIGVHDLVQVATNDRQLATSDHWGRQGTGTGGTDVLADAKRVRRDRERADGDVSGTSGAVAEGNLGLGNGGNQESGDGSDELHDGLEVLSWIGRWCGVRRKERLGYLSFYTREIDKNKWGRRFLPRGEGATGETCMYRWHSV